MATFRRCATLGVLIHSSVFVTVAFLFVSSQTVKLSALVCEPKRGNIWPTVFRQSLLPVSLVCQILPSSLSFVRWTCQSNLSRVCATRTLCEPVNLSGSLLPIPHSLLWGPLLDPRPCHCVCVQTHRMQFMAAVVTVWRLIRSCMASFHFLHQLRTYEPKWAFSHRLDLIWSQLAGQICAMREHRSKVTVILSNGAIEKFWLSVQSKCHWLKPPIANKLD